MNAFNSFVKLAMNEQALLLEEKGLKLDTEFDDNQVINLYFLNGFFVEEIRSACNKIVAILPYKRGYKLETFLNGKIFLN
jgi:hypothetical protein